MRPLPFLLVALLLLPGVAGQLPLTPPDPSTLTPVIVDPNDPSGTALRGAEYAAGTNLTQEDVRVWLDLDFRSLDFDALGVIFGGGDFSAQGRLTAHLEFRAISVARIAPILPAPLSCDGAQNRSCRTVITAGELRATLTGEALKAFEAQEAAALSRLLASTFPDATILNVRFTWSNTDLQPPPLGAPRVPTDPSSLDPRVVGDTREPPLVLDMVLDVQYLKRESLVDIVEGILDRDSLTAEERQKKEDRKALLEQIRGQSTGALYERSAFDILGIEQLIVIEAAPGWDIEITLHLPKGYTYEYASPDVLLGPGRDEASTVTLADASTRPVSNPVAVSLSNRFLVAVALLAAVLFCGALLRFPTMLVANRMRRR